MAARKKGVASIRGHLEEEEERCCIKTALDNDRKARRCLTDRPTDLQLHSCGSAHAASFFLGVRNAPHVKRRLVTLSLSSYLSELTSTDSTDPRDEEVHGETRRGEGEQMSVKVMGEKLADTRSKVSLASSDRLRLDACALFGETAVVAALLSLLRFIPYLSLSS
ncbi:hypothetical protein ALC53_03764 [Atta colombica]|uniref:Uncharacterized protein n=1 Tax=Atta colombica TaxID=520822 RepID=A0A195BM58_9HYME|nr:hypothetical protein ALC53_03764 [Atta colombica]